MKYILLIFLSLNFISCSIFRNSSIIHHEKTPPEHILEGEYVLTFINPDTKPGSDDKTNLRYSLFSIDSKGEFTVANYHPGVYSRTIFRPFKEDLSSDVAPIIHYYWNDFSTKKVSGTNEPAAERVYEIRLQKRGDVLFSSKRTNKNAGDKSPINIQFAVMG